MSSLSQELEKAQHRCIELEKRVSDAQKGLRSRDSLIASLEETETRLKLELEETKVGRGGGGGRLSQVWSITTPFNSR